ncbi:hypothetical protein DAI22_12g113500 [Oryza sativa Japonica Group]|nr:hypothetical protein DAI22_12g113500 [Oryza sativa Japonica Group]
MPPLPARNWLLMEKTEATVTQAAVSLLSSPEGQPRLPGAPLLLIHQLFL